MFRPRFPITNRLLALWLTLALGLPSPALALRPRAGGLGEPTTATAALTQELAPPRTAGLEEQSRTLLQAVDETAWRQLQDFARRMRAQGHRWSESVRIAGFLTDADWTILSPATGGVITPSIARDAAWMLDHDGVMRVITAASHESIEQRVERQLLGQLKRAESMTRFGVYARSGGSRVVYEGRQRMVRPAGQVLTPPQQHALLTIVAEVLLQEIQLAKPSAPLDDLQQALKEASDVAAVTKIVVEAERQTGLIRPDDVTVQVDADNPTMLLVTFADRQLDSTRLIKAIEPVVSAQFSDRPLYLSHGPHYVAISLYQKPSTVVTDLRAGAYGPGVIFIAGDGPADDLEAMREALRRFPDLLIVPYFVGQPSAVRPDDAIVVPYKVSSVAATKHLLSYLVNAAEMGQTYRETPLIRGRYSAQELADALGVNVDNLLSEILPQGFSAFEGIRQARLQVLATGLEEIPQPSAEELTTWLAQLAPAQGPAFRLYGALKDLPPDEQREIAETVARAYQVYGRHIRAVATYLVRTRGRGTEETKPDGTPVLTQDKHIQRRSNILTHRHFPNAAIIGEEQSDLHQDARWWVIRDPLDGTRNYRNHPAVPFPSHYLSTLTLFYRLDDGRMIPVLTIIVAPEHRMGDNPIWEMAGVGIDGVWLNGQVVRTVSDQSLAGIVVGSSGISENRQLNQWYLPLIGRLKDNRQLLGVVSYPSSMAMFEIPLSLTVNPNLPALVVMGENPLWDILPAWHVIEALGGTALSLKDGQRFQPTADLFALDHAARTPALVLSAYPQAARDILAHRPAAGLEEIQLGEPQPLSGNAAVGQVIPVTITGADVWAQGRAVVLDRSRVAIRQFVNPAVTAPQWPGPAIRDLAPAQQPGLRLAELVENPPSSWGSAPNFAGIPLTLAMAMNGPQMNFWERAAFVIRDEQLVAMAGARWSEEPWVFVLDAEQSGVRRLPLRNGRPSADGIRDAIPGPRLVQDGRDVSSEIRQYAEGRPHTDQVRWDPATTRAAFSALGKTSDGRLVWLAVGGRDAAHDVGRASVHDVAQAMLTLGAVEAILLGGSMDVQQWFPGDGSAPGVLGRHIQPPHEAERRLNSAVLVYASARPTDETLVQRFQELSRTLRAMAHEAYPTYDGAPFITDIIGTRNRRVRGIGGIHERLLPAITSLDAAAFTYAPTGKTAARGEVSQSEAALRAFLREDQGNDAIPSELRQRMSAFADTLDQFWGELQERPTENPPSRPAAGLEEKAGPGDSTVPAPDPKTATAADVADYLTRRWGVPVRKDGDDYVVDQASIPEASWTFRAIRPPEPGRVPVNFEVWPERVIADPAAMPELELTYPFEMLPNFKGGTSWTSVYLGFVRGVPHPVVIKHYFLAFRPKDVVEAHVFDRQGSGPRVYGLIQSSGKASAYAMQAAPGTQVARDVRDADPDILKHPDMATLKSRAEDAGMTPASIVKTPSGRLMTIDADNAHVEHPEKLTQWILAQNAGWAVHELQVVRGAPMGTAYLLLNEAAMAALALLKVAGEPFLPVVAVVDAARAERLRAMARQGGFSDGEVAAWERDYLEVYDTPDGVSRATVKATQMLAGRLGVSTVTPESIAELPRALEAFRNRWFELLQGFGLTVGRAAWYPEAIQDLYRAAQA